MITTECRLCRSPKLSRVIDLGFHPLADTFLPESRLDEPETRYPLRVLLCEACGYVMSDYVVSPEERYQKTEYSYDSSNSPVAEKHFEELAGKIAAHVEYKDGVAVDIGSNVGTLLGYLSAHGATPRGVEPAKNIAVLATERGIPTIQDFFGPAAVAQLRKEGVPVRSISATNVFNHLEDVHGTVRLMSEILADDGVIAIEVPYLVTLIEKRAFDTIYLEHVSYFSIEPHLAVFEQYGLYPYHFETNEYMGGSILVILGKDRSRVPAGLVEEFLAKEQACGTRDLATYAAFMRDVESLKSKLVAEVAALKSQRKKIAGLGAATKGNTLLNYSGLDRDWIEYVLETSPLKIGKYTPGSHIPIIAESEIGADITHVLILPWNIGDYLKAKLSHLPVEFIIPRI